MPVARRLTNTSKEYQVSDSCLNASVLALCAALTFGAPAINAADAPPAGQVTSKAQAQASAEGRGTVNKIDAAAGIITVRHDPIAALRWPAMSMDFKVTEKKLLAGLQPGQAISFTLVKQESGSYAISRISAAK
jgi:Cu/Ag efflux protein CusF